MNDPTGKGWAAQNNIQTYPEVHHPLYTSDHRISQALPAENVCVHMLATRLHVTPFRVGFLTEVWKNGGAAS